MAGQEDTISTEQMRAIHQAGRARGFDHEAIREIARVRIAPVASLRDLTREQAHRLLDILNGKDPEKESAKRKALSGAVRRGERPPRGNGNGGGNGEKDKVLRFASDEQLALIRELARSVGLTECGPDGTYRASDEAITNWMLKKFKTAWRELRGRTVMTDGLARKVIHALRDWQAWRHERWAKVFDREIADGVLYLGLDKSFDESTKTGRLPEELVLDGRDAQ